MGAVLIVDDEVTIRDLLRRWLSSAGHDVREAVDAETAIEGITRTAPQVVMCDVEMPGKGGLWLAGQISQRFPATAIVLATGLDSVPPATSLQPGVVQYLVKPFKRERVLDAVTRGIQWHVGAAPRGRNIARDGDPMADWLDSLKD